MLILSLDTTTSAGSCALMRDGELVREVASDPSRSHDSKLPGELESLLQHADVTVGEIDALAVGTGPGSFTGLRVGIATMQGLAVALQVPLFGVSALDALAYTCRPIERQHPRARVAAWIDAWRGEVFAAAYQDGVEVEPAVVARPTDVLASLGKGPTIFIGDGAALYQEVIRSALGGDAHFSEPLTPLLAGAMAALATEEFRRGLRPLPHAIRPLYVRRSDAELARGKR